MFRPSVLISTLLVACAAPDSESPPSDGREGESTMVVPSTAGVPSDDRPVVVFLGTSLTAGFGLDEPDDAYVGRLVELADSVGVPFRAVNAGVSGETSAGGLRRLDWILREPLDLLFLELGANDGLRGQDPSALAENLTEIIHRTRTRYPEARFIIAGMEAPPNLGPRYTGAFRRVFAEVAEREGAELVPFLLEGVAGIADLNQSDRIHPTAEGHGVVARNVWRILEPVLRTLSAEPVG